MKKLLILLTLAMLSIPALAWWYPPCYYRNCGWTYYQPTVYTTPMYYNYNYTVPTTYYTVPTTYYYSAPTYYLAPTTTYYYW